MITVDKHGNSVINYFICQWCGCEFRAYPADCYDVSGVRKCDCPECGMETEVRNGTVR